MNKEDQIKYIVRHAMDTPLKRIAKIIGRSPCFVIGEMKRQKIIVPQEVRDGFKLQSHFKEGREPENKGKRMEEWASKETIEKFKANSFKKGNKPHNTGKNFDISIRKQKNGYSYYWIRLGVNNWVCLHRYLWTQINGEIKEDHNIQFKDGNSLNCDIDNLYLISKSEQSQINIKGGNKIPHELKETILLINKLKKDLNAKQNNRS